MKEVPAYAIGDFRYYTNDDGYIYKITKIVSNEKAVLKVLGLLNPIPEIIYTEMTIAEE